MLIIVGAIMVERFNMNPREEESLSGWTPQQFHKEYSTKIDNNWAGLQSTHKGARGFDVIWTAALVLNNTIQNLTDIGI